MIQTQLRRIIKPFILAATFFFIVTLVWPSSRALSVIPNSGTGRERPGNSTISEQKAAILKIILVLDHQRVDKKLLEKAKDKLLTLNERQILLISSLCEKISYDGQTTRTDIAFLLISALIVLS